HHHHRLGRDQIGAAGAEHVERGRGDGVSSGKEAVLVADLPFFQMAHVRVAWRGTQSTYGPALVVPRLAATAETVRNLPVPPRSAAPGVREGLARLIDASHQGQCPVNGAHLASNDIGDWSALAGGGLR